jgi:hypothetical protein
MNLNLPGFEAIATGGSNSFAMTFWDCNSTVRKTVSAWGTYATPTPANLVMTGTYSVRDATAAITNITVLGNVSFTAGTVQVYGVK